MALRRLQCRAHPGGIFSIHPKRGRQPVSCAPDNPCDKRLTNRAGTEQGIPEFIPASEKPALERVRQRLAESTPGELQPNRFAGVDLRTARQKAESAAEAPKPTNPCLPLAKAAKERLTAVGWVVQGKGGYQGDNPECGHDWWAELTASREHETLFMRWLDGELTDQNYAMEFEKPSDNGFPPNDLHFKPDELSDSELVRMVKGMKVTWWNTIAGSKETAVVGGNVTIEHIFFTNGDEDNAKRIVKFLDHGGGGFRAFHVSALLKVG